MRKFSFVLKTEPPLHRDEGVVTILEGDLMMAKAAHGSDVVFQCSAVDEVSAVAKLRAYATRGKRFKIVDDPTERE